MLTPEENARLTGTGPGTPVGDLVRRYWIPFLLAEDLAEPDCDPVRVRLLGEDLVAFRDTDGRPGLIAKGCPHRLADLWFGRNEEGGIRCTYHGWKFDVTGQCLEAPTGPKEADFASKIRATAYPVAEKAGVLWTYMGPSRSAHGEALEAPELPDFEWMHVPESHRFVSWSTQDCNFVQAIEGGIDTVHSVYLHSNLDSHRKLEEWKQTGRGGISREQARYRTKDNPPRLYAQDTDYGVLVGGKYQGEGEDYWRYNLFLMPFYSMPPGGKDSKLCHAFVPVDDFTTARWSFTSKLSQPYSSGEKAQMRAGQGVHAEVVPGTHQPLRNKANDYLIDRKEQRTYTFTGIKGTGEQDFSVQEGMGPIVDRTQEHLDVTDIGIIQMRRRLMKDATTVQEGQTPYSALHGEVYHVHAGETMLPDGADWVNDERVRTVLTPAW